MTEQLAIFGDFGEFVVPEYASGLTLSERFDAFHAANPWVADALEALAADWLSRGHCKVGVKALAEVLRWQRGRQTVGDQFAINNSYVSRYARLLVERHPEWESAIEMRALKAA